MTRLHCTLAHIECINQRVYIITLEPQSSYTFQAGQYLLAILKNDTETEVPFSIASPAYQKSLLELHISVPHTESITAKLLYQLQQNQDIWINLPHGDAFFRTKKTAPLLLIAGGVGYSYTRSILFTALAENCMRVITLYWGVQSEFELYAVNELKKLAKQYPTFTFIPIMKKRLGEQSDELIEAILEDYESLKSHHIYMAGDFLEMQRAKRHFCAERGAKLAYVYGDAFSYKQ